MRTSGGRSGWRCSTTCPTPCSTLRSACSRSKRPGGRRPPRTIAFLEAEQCPDGGWPYDAFNPGEDLHCSSGETDFFLSDTNWTAYVVMALLANDGAMVDVDDAFDFLWAIRDTDHGGWGYSWGFETTDANSTGLVLQAFAAADRNPPATAERGAAATAVPAVRSVRVHVRRRCRGVTPTSGPRSAPSRDCSDSPSRSRAGSTDQRRRREPAPGNLMRRHRPLRTVAVTVAVLAGRAWPVAGPAGPVCAAEESPRRARRGHRRPVSPSASSSTPGRSPASTSSSSRPTNTGSTYGFGLGGAAVCQLAGVGPAGSDCFAQYPDFWGYWHGTGGRVDLGVDRGRLASRRGRRCRRVGLG